MHTAHGTLSHLSKSLSVNGTHDHVSTTYYATFTLDDYTVTLSSIRPLVLAPGDRLSIAGVYRGEVFHAHAWYNHTAGHQADDLNLSAAILGLAFFCVPFLPLISLGPIAPVIAGSLLSFAVSGYCGFIVQRSWHARRTLEAFLAAGSDEFW